MDTIEGMRTFTAVAKQHSFTAGAKQLGMSTKLASKYVRQLEDRLQAQLFNRTTRKVSLTQTGRAYFDRCVMLLDQFDELEGLVQERQSELAGLIRITAPTAFGSSELVAALGPFQRNHPKLTIDLHLSDHRVSVIEEGFDMAIRFGVLEQSSLIARKLMNMRVVVFAAPFYLSVHGEPGHPNDLANHNCLLRKTSADPEHWKFSMDGEVIAVRVRGSFRANSPKAVVSMAAAGVGVGMCPLYLVQPLVASGAVKLLFEEHEATQLALSAVYPPSRHLTVRVRALLDHLAAHFKKTNEKKAF